MTRLRLNTVLRVGVRTLLVAGFAGGAWLLSSAAAHAAAPAGDTTTRTQAVVDPTLRLLDQVLTSGIDGSGSAASSAAQRPGAVASHGHHSARPAAVPVTGLPAPVRPASQAVSGERSHRSASAGPVALSRLISSAFDLVRPLSGTTERVSAPVTELLSFATGYHSVGRVLPAYRTVARAVVPGGADVVEAAPATVDKAQHSTRIRPHAGITLPTAPASRRPAVAGTHQVPYFPGRAPTPAYPDPGSSTGISTTASGSQHDAGAYAVVTAPVAAGHLADLRRLRATQVAVRLLLADAPTFAPD
jgi:hypothetical protein